MDKNEKLHIILAGILTILTVNISVAQEKKPKYLCYSTLITVALMNWQKKLLRELRAKKCRSHNQAGKNIFKL